MCQTNYHTKGGRPQGLTAKARETARIAGMLYKENKMPVSKILLQLNISRATFYKYLRLEGISFKALKKNVSKN